MATVPGVSGVFIRERGEAYSHKRNSGTSGDRADGTVGRMQRQEKENSQGRPLAVRDRVAMSHRVAGGSRPSPTEVHVGEALEPPVPGCGIVAGNGGSKPPPYGWNVGAGAYDGPLCG